MTFASITLLLYVAGPIPWPHASPRLLAFVLFSFWFSLAGVYVLRLRTAEPAWSSTTAIDVQRLVRASLLLNALSFPFAIWAYTGGSVADLSFSLESQGSIYLDRVAFSRAAELSGARLLAVLIRTASSPIIFAGLILGIRQIRHLDRRSRLALALSIMLQVAFSFGRGTDKEIVDLCIFAAVAAMAAPELSLRRLAKLLVRVVAGSSVLLFLFSARRSARVGDESRCVPIADDCLSPSSRQLQLWLGRDASLLFERIVGYVSQGYYGLELGLSQEYSWTAGRASVRQLGLILGPPRGQEPTFAENLLASGWDPGARWSTIFAQIVSDSTIYLVPVLGGLTGVVLCACWRRSILGDLSAYVVSTYLILQLFYASANIQLTGSSDTFLTVLIWSGFTLVFRRRPLVAAVGPIPDGLGSKKGSDQLKHVAGTVRDRSSVAS